MKAKTYNTLFIMLAVLILATGCTSNYKYKIGVSQCVGGRWREKANIEMLSAQHLYDTDVKVIIKNADNRNERQCLQIDSLINEGVDLLVVSPNDYHALNGSLRGEQLLQIVDMIGCEANIQSFHLIIAINNLHVAHLCLLLHWQEQNFL